jgi:hypothetical protein
VPRAMQQASLTPATSWIAPHRDGSGWLRLTIQTGRIRTSRVEARATTGWTPPGRARVMQNNGGTTPTIAKRRAPPLDRKSNRPVAEFARSTVCGTFEFVSREAVTFRRGPRRRHHAGSPVQCVTNAGPGGSQREPLGGNGCERAPR